MNVKVLVVDDEVNLLQVVKDYLLLEAYEVYTAENGKRAMEIFHEVNPDFIILDLMLPDLSGEEICKRIRKEADTPILMLTAKSAEEDKVNGLYIGADDYLTKPFSPRELVGRVRAILRRTKGEGQVTDILSYNQEDLVIDIPRHMVKKAGQPVNLTPNEYKILLTLAQNPHKTFSRGQLISNALGYDFEGYDRTVDTHIKNIRQKTEDDIKEPKYIVTVYGVGYRFEGEYRMQKIKSQLRKYFILISIISVIFITIISNLSINLFFSKYVRESRDKDDLNIVENIEQLYNDNNGLNSSSLMGIMHYTASNAVNIRIKDMNGEIVWESESQNSMMGGMMGGMMGKGGSRYQGNLEYKDYPMKYKEQQVGAVEIGRPQSIFSSPEDKSFVFTMNGVYAFALIISIVLAIFLSLKVSKKFLQPIYKIKENAELIENAKYKHLKQVDTSTVELRDLSESIRELAERLEYQETLRKRMTSDIAHELRTPLSTLQSHIEAFMDGVWQPTQEKFGIIYIS